MNDQAESGWKLLVAERISIDLDIGVFGSTTLAYVQFVRKSKFLDQNHPPKTLKDLCNPQGVDAALQAVILDFSFLSSSFDVVNVSKVAGHAAESPSLFLSLSPPLGFHHPNVAAGGEGFTLDRYLPSAQMIATFLAFSNFSFTVKVFSLNLKSESFFVFLSLAPVSQLLLHHRMQFQVSTIRVVMVL
ncbi:hypothetical protein RHMOL_Rhmol08G0236800 [Rhododendron molle]|uniref:Uncharacterized protein n=1 Tax=Rhododendron molle TaxID=49168 RepID=A0ACC0MRL7_RHOML|nr:hypothetical protein RHMOL_Rhmol08G0236800 [Rhododendron molle]